MNNFILHTEYRGAKLALELADDKLAILSVNGINRCQETGSHGVIRLSSTVQTDYEWHEFIEGLVTFNEESVLLSIIANNTEVAHKTFTR